MAVIQFILTRLPSPCAVPSGLILLVGLTLWVHSSVVVAQQVGPWQSVQLKQLLRVQVEGEIGQLRAVPVVLGSDAQRGFLTIHSADPEIDPFISMFFFPRDTLTMTMFSGTGEKLWERDLGRGVVPGIWFCPVFSFDLDSDGSDEIWYVGNRTPEHPLDYREYQLVRLDGKTGEELGRWPWPHPQGPPQSMSHTYRNFILGGFIHDRPILVTAQGTYGRMSLQAWDAEMSQLWEIDIDPQRDGLARGSHVSPVVDLDGDGVDELLWGERVIELDTGIQRFCADQGKWNGHSDIVLPVLLRDRQQWLIFTCREEQVEMPPRIVMYDASGRRLWTALEEGHIDTGWAAHLAAREEATVLGVRIGHKVRDATGERRTATESFLFDARSGTPIEFSFDPYTTVPVDLDGDGKHELVKGYFEGNGDVYNSSGETIGNVGGLVAMCSKFVDHPGEQILSYRPDGQVTVWADEHAHDRPAAIQRYKQRFYYTNQRMTACGYNLFNLGGL